MATRELFVRIYAVKTKVSPAEGISCCAAVDGKARKTELPERCDENGAIWAQENGSVMKWTVSEKEFIRLQAHEPRIKVEVMNGGNAVGFVHFDLRDVDYWMGCSGGIERSVQSSSGFEGTVVLQVSTRNQSKMGEGDPIEEEGSSIAVSVNKKVPKVSPIGVAITDDFVLIGSSGDLEMTLYITLMNVSGLTNIQESTSRQPGMPLPSRTYWVQYNIFGVEVDTDRFSSLRYPKFTPIRDSFRIRSTRDEVAQVLQGMPLRVYLCGEDSTPQGKRRQAHPEVIASTLMDFQPLFSSGSSFSEATSNSAFPLQAHIPHQLRSDNGPSPSVAVSMELHVHGPVEKIVPKIEDEETVVGLRNSFAQTDSESPITQSLAGDLVNVAVKCLEFDPFDGDFDDDEEIELWTLPLSLSIGIEGKEGTTVKSASSFSCDEYGQMEQQQLDDLVFAVRQSDLLSVKLFVYSTNGVEVASGNLSASLIDCSRIEGSVACTVKLFDMHGLERGKSELKLTAAAPKSSQADVIRQEPPTLNTSTFILESPSSLTGLEPDKDYLFRMTIDLRSIKGTDNSPSYVYLQYSNKLLGGSQIFQTRPPILMDKYSERIIPHGLRLFQFRSSKSELDVLAQSEPVVVEMWRRDKYLADSRLGFAALPLRKLFERQPYFQWAGQTFSTLNALELQRDRILASAVGKSSEPNAFLATSKREIERARKQADLPIIQVQVLETDLIVCAFGNDDKSSVQQLATVRCTLTLENLGPAKESKMKLKKSPLKGNPKAEQRSENQDATGSLGVSEDGGHQTDDDNTVHDGEEATEEKDIPAKNINAFESQRNIVDDDYLQAYEALRAAWIEFEQWKEEQKKSWEVEMRTAEAVRMSELEQAWAKREHERAVALKTAQEEFSRLEHRMERATADAEKRERNCARLEVDLQRAADQRLADLELLSRRTREESEHQISVHKNKCTALENEVARLRRSLQLSEKRAQKVEDEFATFREKIRQSPEAALQREIAKLQGLNAQLHSQLEQEKDRTANERLAKEGLRGHVSQLSREIEVLRKEESLRAEKQLENLRLEYLAREERFVLDGDRQHLQQLRQELNELRVATLRQPWPSGSLHHVPRPLSRTDSGESTLNPAKESRDSPRRSISPSRGTDEQRHELERLELERADLISSGLYNEDHPILQQLNRHISLVRENLV